MYAKKPIGVIARLSLAAMVVGVLAIAGCSAQPETPTQAQANQIAMNFDLSKCEVLEPSLYRCPGSDKSICTPGFARADIECLKADNNGVLIQTP